MKASAKYAKETRKYDYICNTATGMKFSTLL